MKDQISVIAAPLRMQVIELLRNAIISFEYEPGSRLVERELCERMGVSRTVIREALRQLEAEGLVDLVPNRGPVVATTGRQEAMDLYEVREAIEALAVRLCAERASASQITELEQALAAVADAYDTDDLLQQLETKDRFYRVLCDGSGNQAIATTLRGVNARVQLLRGLSLGTPGRPEKSLAELNEIVSAIRDGRSEEAAALAVQHVRNAAEAALERLEAPEEQRPLRASQVGT